MRHATCELFAEVGALGSASFTRAETVIRWRWVIHVQGWHETARRVARVAIILK
jgi:hypothetical protein